MKEKEMVSEMMIHSADFSGNIQEFQISKIWSEKVNQEFR